MNNDWSSLFDQMAEANDQVVAAAAQFHKIAARAQSTFARYQFSTLESCLEASTDQLRLVGSGQEPKEILDAQMKMASEFGEKLAESAQQTLQSQVQARDELMSLFGESMKTLQNKAESVAAPMVAATSSPAPARRTTRSRRKTA
jgi:hypothetical protein